MVDLTPVMTTLASTRSQCLPPSPATHDPRLGLDVDAGLGSRASIRRKEVASLR